MTEHNAVGTRVTARPIWTMFVLMFLTGGLYRVWWAWRSTTDIVAFTRPRHELVSDRQSVHTEPGGVALFAFFLSLGVSLVVAALAFTLDTAPAEFDDAAPSHADALALLISGACLAATGLISLVRTRRRIVRARALAGLQPRPAALTAPAFACLMILELFGLPLGMLALQHALNDLWRHYPPLLDPDLHGELAPPATRAAALARRDELHDARLAHIADEIEQPGLLPWVTCAFAVLCCVVFAWQITQHGLIPTTSDIEHVGGYYPGIEGAWWKFWVANVLHGSIAHLMGNMFAWLVAAALVERVVGHLRTFALIVVGAAGTSLGALVAHTHVAAVGASGVVFAAFGMAAMVDPLARRAVGKVGWLSLVLGLGLSTFAAGIASSGHVGGAIAGLLLGAVVLVVWRVPHRRAGARRAATYDLTRVINPAAPLAPNRTLAIQHRLDRLHARLRAGEIDERQFERLRAALVYAG